MAMAKALDELTHALIDAALKAGAEAADAMALRGQSVTIDMRGGTLEQAERAEGVDIGLRVLIGGRQASVSASDTGAATIAALAERAVAMAREAPVDPYAGLAEPGQLARDWDVAALELCDPSPEPAPDALARMAQEAEAAALGVAGVTQVQAASATYSHRAVHIAASNGFSGGYARSDTGLSCVAIAGTGTGMERDYDGDSRIFASDLRDAGEIGRRAGARAVERLGARRPRTGAYPVLFDERISGSLIGHLLAAVSGASVARGSSWLRERLGEQVLPEALPTAKRAIVQDGVLTGWTLDLATARKLGMQSTANATRGTSSAPSPGTWNIALTQGTQSRDDLIREMGTGLLVTSMIGSTINPNTGDYSRGAAGFWIEQGEIAYPVNECTIAGSLPEMLRRMIPANDARLHVGRVVPSLLIEGLTLAGE
jgi:PmbA protein